MPRVFISISDSVAERFRALVPLCERRRLIERLLTEEIRARESTRDDGLSRIAKQIESDSAFAAVREVSADADNVAGEAID